MEIVVGKGVMRITPWYENVVRIQFAPDGAIARQREFFLDEGSAPDCRPEWSEDDARVTVRLSDCQATFHKESQRVVFADAYGKVVLAEAGRDWCDTELPGFMRIRQTFSSAPGERLYGLGNVNGIMGIRGETVEIRHTNCGKRTPVLQSNHGYGLFFNLPCNGALEWDLENDMYCYTGSYAHTMDYFFLLGSPAEIVRAYRRLTGRAALLPKKAFGYIHSRNRFENQATVLATAKRFRDEHIPLDELVIDYKWWGLDPAVWNSFQWDATDWPSPEAMLAALHNQYIDSAISVWPDFVSGNAAYAEMEHNGYLLEPHGDTGRRTYDAGNAGARRMYWELIRKTVFSKGIDSIWLDANEPEIGAWTGAGCFSDMGSTLPYGLVYPLLDCKAVYEGQRALGERRVSTLSRGAVAGIQRYGIVSWSGDIPATWRQLKDELVGVLNLHAAGLPFFSTDTGGYFGIDTQDPDKRELFLRWLQFSVFCSILRVHGRDCDKAPWCFGEEYGASIAFYLRLRMRLLPYLHTLAIETAIMDDTMARPIFFDYPDDEQAWRCPGQFMLGKSLLAAPVTAKDADAKDVYLPKGAWYDLFTGERIESDGAWHKLAAPIGKLPVLAPEGSILTLGPDVEWADGAPEEITVLVFSGKDAGFVLREEDGLTYAYERGALSEIPLLWDESTKRLFIGERNGRYARMPEVRRVSVIVITPDGALRSPQIEYRGETLVIDDFSPTPYSLTPPTVTRRTRARTVAPPHSILGHWLFQEGEGGAIGDSSGNLHTGRAICCEWTNGAHGPALSLNGFNSYADMGDDSALNPIGGLGLFVRFRPRRDGVIVSKGGLNGERGYTLRYARGTLSLHLVGDGALCIEVGGLAPDCWIEATATWDAATGEAALYVGNAPVARGLLPSGPAETDEGLCFGRSESLAEGPFCGAIDEVLLTNDPALVAGIQTM